MSNEQTQLLEQKLKNAIDVLHGCAGNGGVINPSNGLWFEGYAKACQDIKELVVDAGFNGKPLPVRFQPRNAEPECKQT